MSTQQVFADCFLFQGLVFMVLYLVTEFPYSSFVFWSVVLTSIVGFIGSYMMYEAVVYGKAAPSQAINGTQSLFTLILEIVILSIVPSTLEIIAFFIGLGGSLLIAFESKKDNE